MKQNNLLALELVKLTGLMERTSGTSELKIALIDGPVVMQHTDLAGENLIEIYGNKAPASCAKPDSTACMHGTFVAGILSGKRYSVAPSICPGCTLLLRPVFSETTSGNENMPDITPLELADAIIECIYAGAKIINLSLAIVHLSSRGERALEEALYQAMISGVIVVAAAGNQGSLGSSAITRHHWVIPVIACNSYGIPMNESNLGNSVGRRGLSAPGDNITSIGAEGHFITLSGTSVAVPFVTGAIALLWSEFPTATAAQIKLAITQSAILRQASVVPPLLDANTSYQILLKEIIKKKIA